jgi:hypothetical protein
VRMLLAAIDRAGEGIGEPQYDPESSARTGPPAS